MKRAYASLWIALAIITAAVPCLCADNNNSATHEQEKSDLRVLYVGPNPDEEIRVPGYITGNEAERFVELKKERKSAFKALLEEHFANVKLINAEDYVPEMSAEADVTIFDELTPAIRTVDVDGWKKPIRLPDDFHHASLMIGEVGPLTLGRHGLGLQIGHL